MDPRETAKRSGESQAASDTTFVGKWIKEKYRLDSKLGEGGMAVVYAATHRNKKRFALKMLRPELSIEGDIKTRFLREGYVANTVDHPGVVAVLDDDVTEDGCAFLVMELLDGQSVEEISDKQGGKLDERSVLVIAHQLLDVLVSAHSKNVVHRDLKPGNLFVTRAGQLKVLDFGIARIRDSNLTNATNTGHAMGTPAFMGPEQARGKTSLIGPKTDLWSVGATMFSLLSSLNVHEGESAQEVVFQAASSPARSLTSVMKVSPTIVHIVDRALAFEPKDRWPDAAAMRDAIADAYRSLHSVAISTAPLAELLQTRVRIEASNPSLSAHGAGESAPTLALPVNPAVSASPAISAVVGRITEQPVSSSARQSIRSQRGRVAIIAGVSGVVVFTAVAFGIASKSKSTAVVASEAPQSPTASPSILPSALPSELASAEPPASTVASASASSSASSTPPAKTSTPHHTNGTDKPHSHNSSDFDRR